MHYYININGSNIGPMTKEQLMAYNVNENTQISKDGAPWAPLYTYPELMAELRHSHNTTPSAHSEISSKRVTCGVLAILLGTLGIQYFVIGKTAGGLITILLSIVTCGAWGIVTLIQGILILCMTDSEFQRKYLESTNTLPLF